jgi:2-polyprenyl-6-methoxyphenol hydroxylase-like FAD-dependent oxidoreductase
MDATRSDILIIGGGIGGLTLALALHRAGVPCRLFEAAPEVKPLGVGINLLPHSTAVLGRLGLEAALASVAITTMESVYFTRFGQLVHREPAGRAAGHATPQFSIHRADVHRALVDAVIDRLGADRFHLGWKCVGFDQDDHGVTVQFVDAITGAALEPQRGSAAVGCDGIHSVVRKQLHPSEGEPIYSGVNMWRGTTVWEPILSGASMIRAGWLTPAKIVVYPIRDNVDGRGRQLVNWVVEIETPTHLARDWNRRGRLDDFIGPLESWHFDWLDVPAFIGASEQILEFPMVDQDPLPFWTRGRVTLLGDAAHPMYPRGSNGAGQAIVDAQVLSALLARHADVRDALVEYQFERLPATAAVVQMNRTNPPDAILREVQRRSGDKPFRSIDEVMSRSEMEELLSRYRQVTGNLR